MVSEGLEELANLLEGDSFAANKYREKYKWHSVKRPRTEQDDETLKKRKGHLRPQIITGGRGRTESPVKTCGHSELQRALGLTKEATPKSNIKRRGFLEGHAEGARRGREEGLTNVERLRNRGRRSEEGSATAFVQTIEDARTSRSRRPTRAEGKDGRRGQSFR
jgi:hypothetical protein